MAASFGTFNLLIMNPDRKIFEGNVGSLFVQGDTGHGEISEYEILPYHYPVLGLLRPGRLIIDWNKYLPVNKGIIKFFKNDCVILVELAD